VRLSVETSASALLSLAARPLRSLVLVPRVAGVAWEAIFTAALANQCVTWGGSANLVVPLIEDLRDDERFWALADMLDPDSLVLFGPSVADLEDLDTAQWDKRQPDIEAAGDEAWRVLEEPVAEVNLDVGLIRQIAWRTASVHRSDLGRTHGVANTTALPYPGVDALELRPLPARVLDPRWEGAPLLSLMLAAEMGALSRAQRRRLEAAGVNVTDGEFENELVLLNHVFGAAVPDEVMPWEIAERGLAWFRSTPLTTDRLCVVAGDDPWDFSLAYAVRRAHIHAFWLPETGLAAQAPWASSRLAAAARRSGLPLVVTSATDASAAHRLSDQLTALGAAPAVVPWRDVLPRRPNRLRLMGSLALPSTVLLDERSATPPLPTPIPEVQPTSAQHLRWMTEVDVHGWCALRHPEVGDHLVAGSVPGNVRPTTDGVAYFCPSWMVELNVPLEYQTTRPSLKIQPLLDQLCAAGAPDGWTCELSDKGAFTIAAAALFGGVSELAEVLTTPELSAVLGAFLDGSDSAPGLKLSDRRRYLSAEDLRMVTDDCTDYALQRLLSGAAVTRGFVLKCGRCRHTAWYRLRATDPRFTCQRCAYAQNIDALANLGKIDPSLYYRLDEAFFQFLRHRGDIAVLAATALYGPDELPALMIPELELRHEDGLKLEVDFVVATAGDLDVGEAFTSDRYSVEKEAERLSELARAAAAFNARMVTLCTAAADVHPNTRARLEAAIPGPWPRHRVISGARMLPRPARLVDEIV